MESLVSGFGPAQAQPYALGKQASTQEYSLCATDSQRNACKENGSRKKQNVAEKNRF